MALSTPPDRVTEPVALRRADGASVYTIAGADLYTSRRIMDAERRLITAAGFGDGKVVDDATIAVALLEAEANGIALNAGQATLVREMAGSGARVQVAIAPAGSGKTTAMRALSLAWSDAGGTVLGLAPSAAAAAALGAQIDTHTDTLAKLTWSIDHDDLPEWAAQIGPNTLVIIDEAGMADTLSLDAAVTHMLNRGASIRLIGDDQQLAAIGAGGVLRDIATQHGALRLNELVRFADPAEGGASLALREGQPEALGFYLDRGRVHVGDLGTMTDAVFAAWQADTADGRDVIMLAPTRDLVGELNQRARAQRLAGTRPAVEVELADGNAASVGDTLITRTNDRRLRTSSADWVKNGDRWTITEISPSVGVRARHTRTHSTVTLPTAYLAASTELGYASTVHTAQGLSVDTMHGLATGSEGRQQLYTMLTRGRHANHVYLQVVGDGDPHTTIRPDTIHPPTATDLLEGILARDVAPTSATSLHQQLQDPGVRLGEAVARYTDSLSLAAEHVAGDLAVRSLAHRADHLLPGLPRCDAWPALRAHLLLLGADGRDPIDTLATAASRAKLGSAADPAAVLDWRLDDTGHRNTNPGPLPWLLGIPRALAADPEWGPYLTARSTLVSALAATVHEAAAQQTRTPAWLPPGVGQPTSQTLADITVWRAAVGVPESDRRPTGERQLQKAAARHQRELERRLAGDRQPALREWGPLLQQFAPTLAHDDFTRTLAQRLAHLSSAGLDARGLLHRAAGEGALPDDHPAAALWWRIARHLTPAVATAIDTDRPVTRPWVGELADTVGSEMAYRLQQSPWWPALVTAVDHGLQRGWTPAALLAGQSRPDTDTHLDDCLALVWRISTLTEDHHPDEDAAVSNPADEPPVDLWDGYEPHDPIIIGGPNEVGAVRVEPVDEAAFATPWDAEPGDLTLEALIRERLGAPEPTREDVAKMFARADAWRDCPATPERLARINQLTADFYQACYPGSWAQPYLSKRFRTDLTGHPDYQPGYAPNTWNSLVNHLRHHGVADEEMLAAGVATTASTGRLIDRFRDRAVFPIRHDGVVLGFVGRRHPDLTDTDKAGPKYLNTPETPLFHKGDRLFSPVALTPDATPVIVEGPMDAIAVTLASNGRFVGVAPLGTSLTDDQAAQLRTMGRHPIVATDADLPGRVAAERDYWILTPQGLNPSYAQLPAGKDPASLLSDGHADRLVEALKTAAPLGDTLIAERLANLSAADSVLAALRVIAAQPSSRWETGIQHIAEHANLPATLTRGVLKDLVHAWNQDPRGAAELELRAMNDVKTRLARAEGGATYEVVQTPGRAGVEQERHPQGRSVDLSPGITDR